LRRGFGQAELALDRAGMGEQPRAGGGQADLLAIARHQRRADQALQFGDPAESVGWLRFRRRAAAVILPVSTIARNWRRWARFIIGYFYGYPLRKSISLARRSGVSCAAEEET
jgi:hypothetical protein